MATKVNTRIVLKNDELSNWLSGSSIQLKQGEVVLAKNANGSYELRVGQDGKQFAEAARLQLSADQIVGLEAGLSTSFSEVGALSDLTATYNNGSIAVVTADIDGTHKEYTAYYYDTSLNGGTWRQMDGNYNAENVYFSKDLTYTTAVGELPAVGSSGSGTLAAKGKNVKQVFDAILAKEKNPTIPTPSVTVNTTASAKEYGTTVTPAYSFTFNKGTYTYGPSDDGVAVSAWTVKAGGSSITPSSQTATTITGNASEVTLTSSYKIEASASYTAGVNAYTNLGNDSGLKVAAGTASNSKTIYTVYKPNFYGFAYTAGKYDFTNFTDANLTSLTNQGSTETPLTQMTATGSWFQLVYAVPTGRKSSLAVVDKNGLPHTVKTTTVTHTWANGDTTEYTVFYVSYPAAYDTTVNNLTWK